MRKLASIRRISEIEPIDGADRIEKAVIDGWAAVVRKDQFKPGDLCVYFEIDSLIPIRPWNEFLKKTSKKSIDGVDWIRIRTVVLKDQVSQGLVMPLDILNSEDETVVGTREDGVKTLGPYDDSLELKPGMDVSKYLGVIKYEPTVVSEGVLGDKPGFLETTDAERVQNMAEGFDEFVKDKTFYVTEKLDGTSTTIYYNPDHDRCFGICNRNSELEETDRNIIWKIARQLDIEERLKEHYETHGKKIALQGELVGPGIQKNRLGLDQKRIFFFGVFDIDTYSKMDPSQSKTVVQEMGLEFVPVIEEQYIIDQDARSLLDIADGKSKINPERKREGLVMRCNQDPKVIFKLISNDWLIKNED